MTKDSRTKNTTRNIAAGLFNRMVAIILPFINRTIIIYFLGVEFTGLGSLFNSILSVLSIADLGFNNAIIYSMYDPISKDDEEKICELLTLYRKIYFVVGIVILSIGLVLLPFIQNFINGEIPTGINIYCLYLLYLVNSVLSYFLFAYKEALFLANQRQDLSQRIRTAVLLLQYIVQAVLLIIFKNFYFYLIVMIVCTIFTNLLIGIETSRFYPQYHYKKNIKSRIPLDIKRQTGGLIIEKICDKTRNSVDSIIISSFFGLALVGIYNNYFYIYTALYGIILVICNSMGASVGNSIVEESVEKNYNDLRRFSFIQAWFSGWVTICMLCLYQPFMRIWVGKNNLLPNTDMFLICLYFYLINMNNIRNQYIAGTGIWWRLRISYLMEVFANLILNVILGKLMGITGIILATILTIFFLTFLWRNLILFKTYFKEMSFKKFLLDNFLYSFCIFILAIITYIICKSIKVNDWLQIVVNFVVCVIFPNILMIAIWKKTWLFSETKKVIKNVLKFK